MVTRFALFHPARLPSLKLAAPLLLLISTAWFAFAEKKEAPLRKKIGWKIIEAYDTAMQKGILEKIQLYT
jgi:hypothetical protein